MNTEYRHLLPDNFSPSSKVWVYQASRMLTMQEALEAETMLENFSREWRSHGDEVQAWCNLLFGQFIVMMADESRTTVGGCSTDASVRFVKSIGEKFNVDFFDRTSLAFVVKDKIQVLPMNQLAYALDNGFIDAGTLYFNNLVNTKEQLEKNWIIPVRQSWIASRYRIGQEQV